MGSDVYNTTVNVNGNTMFSSTFYPGYCCCGNRMYMNSCFGFGYGGIGSGLGFGLGYAAGISLVPLMPTIIKGIDNGLSWFGTKVIAPAAKGVWSGIKWTGKTVAKGVSNLWNNIFHKKSKTTAEKS